MQNKTPEISIVVPIYNCEVTLKKCVESILCQTFDDFELILIDDGSKDASFELCKMYANKDLRVKCFHKENSGVSETRNFGIELAQGKYLTFVDADDYLKNSHLTELVRVISNSDISAVGLYNVKNGKLKENVLNQDYVWDRSDFFYHVVSDNCVGGYLWNKLLKTDIVKKNKLCLKKEIKVSEDMLFLCEYLQFCENGSYSRKATYFYVDNANSAMRKMYKTMCFDTSKISTIDAADSILGMSYHGTRKMRDGAEYRFVRARLWILMNMIFCNYQDRELFQRISEITFRQVYSYCKTPSATIVEKISVIFMKLNPKFLYLIGTTLGKPLNSILKNKVLN